eukprot:GHVT01073606.1.p1 GENE.GHVT01073606.1~~GHVT01073606.1.p1  ORF type:complete len:323 (+),score=55.44 GHVT01073606.1:229-1197(+)
MELEELVGRLPPVSRVYLLCSFTLMVLCSLDVVSPYSLYLNWTLVLRDGQVWRLLTSLLFFGTFGLNFFWNTYVLIFYCANLEEIAFRSKSANFLWMLICNATMLLLASYLLGGTSFFVSGAMVEVMTYLWGRRNPHSNMTIFFFTVRAPYVPWLLAVLSLFIGWTLFDHLLGIAVGHTFYFFDDVYPLLPSSGGLRIFKTPQILKTLMGQRQDDEDVVDRNDLDLRFVRQAIREYNERWLAPLRQRLAEGSDSPRNPQEDRPPVAFPPSQAQVAAPDADAAAASQTDTPVEDFEVKKEEGEGLNHVRRRHSHAQPISSQED